MTEGRTLLAPEIVGRGGHLALVKRRLSEVLQGKGQLLLISGEAGIGKSRLLGATTELATERGFRVAKGEVAPQDHDVLAASFLDLGRAMRRNAAFASMGRDLLEISAARLTAANARRRDYVMELVDLIGSVDEPTVLIFEDLHWADDLSLEALTELARQTRDRPLLIVGAYRSNEALQGSVLREWRSRLVTQRIAEEIRLLRLSRDETAEVIMQILGDGLPAARDVVDAIYARTDGVPLHIEELVSALGAERLADSRAVLEAAVPETLEDATLARMARLSKEAQAAARAGAVIGRSFVPSVLAGIMNVPVEALDAPLDELVRHDLLETNRGGSQFDFRHQLLRDALYRSVPAAERRRFHARAAEFGGQLEGASDIHASMHYERAGMTEKAFRTAFAAAEQAQRMSSHREAFELVRRALQNMPASLPDEQKVQVLLLYANVAFNLDVSGPANEFAERARTLALRIGDQVGAITALAILVGMARRDGESLTVRRDLAQQLLNQVEAAPPGRELEELRVWALYQLMIVAYDANDLTSMRALLLECREVGERAGAIVDRSVTRELVGAALWVDNYLAQIDIIEGHVLEGLATIRALGETVRAQGQEDTGVGCYLYFAIVGRRAMEFREAGADIVEGLRYAESVQQRAFGHVLASVAALLAWDAGEWDAALRQGSQALSDPGSGWSHDLARLAIGYFHVGRGDRSAAEEQLLPALAFGLGSERLDLILPAQWGLAEAALHSGDPGRAAAICDEALGRAEEERERTLIAPFAVTAVRAHQGAGAPDHAARYLDRFTELVAGSGDISRPSIQHATGLVRLAEGSLVAARVALDDAASMWNDRGRAWESMWARTDLASALLRSSRFVDAAKLIARVREFGERVQSKPLLARVEQLERVARGRGSEQEPWHPLTIREFEVARRIADGLTNAEVADELGISPKTASAHLEHIFAKLGVSRRAEVAAWAATVASPPSAAREPGGMAIRRR
jgi:DNA-binding CsgD family transcriptional regulator